jgi:hypothetical protein
MFTTNGLRRAFETKRGQQVRDDYSPDSAWLRAEGLLGHIVGHVKEAPHKMTLLFGHFGNIIAVTAAFGFHEGNIARWSMRLAFEVYERKHGSYIETYIRIIYDGQDVTPKSIFCTQQKACFTLKNPGESHVYHLIPSQAFIAFISNRLSALK